VDSTWSCEALQQLQRCRLFGVQRVAAVALEPLPELVEAAEVPELEAVVGELLVEALVQVEALEFQLSLLRQASPPVLPMLPPDHHLAPRQPH